MVSICGFSGVKPSLNGCWGRTGGLATIAEWPARAQWLAVPSLLHVVGLDVAEAEGAAAIAAAAAAATSIGARYRDRILIFEPFLGDVVEKSWILNVVA